jgi:Holliday junction resolvase RusA-like endonuclease
MPSIDFKVIGTPGPQGSKRFVGTKNGRGIMVESSSKVRPWREAVVWAARAAMETQGRISGPVVVAMVFTVTKPKSAPKKRITYPATKPDLSKLARSTEDALTTAGIYEDDARIICYDHLAKVYPNESPRALDVPGAWIRVRSVGE